MFRRCTWCRAWLWESPGKPDRILMRTAETAFCFRCEGERGRARGEARSHARRAPMREWLGAAPLFSDRLLVKARTSFERRLARAPKDDRRGDRRERPTGTFAPWVDTLDLDRAASWLELSTDGGKRHWPPASDDACRRLAEAVRRLDFRDAEVVDVGAVFGSRGLPYPAVPDVHRDLHRRGWSVYPSAGLVHLEGSRILPDGRSRLPLGAAGLPDGYADVLGLEMMISRGSGYHSPPGFDLRAIGSVFRDADGRVVVLWRDRGPWPDRGR